MSLEKSSKYKKLGLSLLFDALGFVSFAVPVFDIVWAPAAGYLMTKMYKGKSGKIAGIIVFVEEALPFLDVVPTFTIMWVYTYFFATKTEIVDVD